MAEEFTPEVILVNYIFHLLKYDNRLGYHPAYIVIKISFSLI